MTTLQAIHGENPWCVPAALSAITGKSTDECAELIREVTGQRHAVTAVYHEHYVEVLRRLRHDVIPVELTARTLFGTLHSLVNFDSYYLIRLDTGRMSHAIVVEIRDKRIFLIDNHTKEAIPAHASARLTQKVVGVFKISARPEKKYLRTEVNVERTPIRCYIETKEIYEDSRDNVVRRNTLVFKNDDELKLILMELMRAINTTRTV